MKANGRLTVHTLPALEHLKIHGRSSGRLDPLTLFWSGSGIEANVTGSELWVEVEAAYNTYEPWISVSVNGAPVSRMMLTEGRYWLCLFRGMNKKSVKNIRIVKETQAMSEDHGCRLQLHALKSDGSFRPVREKPYKLEFIGDSITSGEGNVGARSEEDWIPMFFGASSTYAFHTAEMLDADLRILSQSGWGVLTGWNNNPDSNLPRYYEQVCGLAAGEANMALGAHDPYDFEAWRPDAVIVNLGSNDAGAFFSPEWKDPSSGRRHKQRLNADGSFNEDDLRAFEEAAERFLETLRRCNSTAAIVWAYGMLGAPLMPAIYRAVDAYRRKTGDRNVSVFQLPNTTEETMGSRKHPGPLSHLQAARELSGYLRPLLQARSAGTAPDLNSKL